MAVVIGTSYGMVSGMCGGKTDALMMRIVDIIYSLPFTIFVILLMMAFGRSLWLIFVAIGAVEWLTMARIVRAMTLDIKSRQFVEAAVALGESRLGIMRRHILPNVFGSVLVCAALTVPSRYAFGGFFKLFGARSASSFAVVGRPCKRRCGIYGRRPVDVGFPGFVF